MSDVVEIGLEVHFGLQILVQKVVNKGAAFCIKLLPFFEDSGALGRPNWSISLIFHWFYCYLVDTDFGHAGAPDDVVGKVQNDELSRVQECFNFLSEIEYLVLGRLGEVIERYAGLLGALWPLLGSLGTP